MTDKKTDIDKPEPATSPRRRFMTQSALLVSGLALGKCAPQQQAPAASSSGDMDPQVLQAIARIVLPVQTLGDAGVERVLTGFLKWLQEFEPVAEMAHAYLTTDEIPYGPPDPAPLWASQLSALQIEAHKRYSQDFAAIETEKQVPMLRGQLPDPLPESLPRAGAAAHVALGLLSYFYASSEANDLCYQSAIERQTCRGLESGAVEPAKLSPVEG